MESFGQLVIQGILLMRFEWLVRKDDFNSFGVTFQIFVTVCMGISFFTMTKAVMAYHNRSRESLRPTFSLGGISIGERTDIDNCFPVVLVLLFF